MLREIPGFRFAARLIILLIVTLLFASASRAENLDVNVGTSEAMVLFRY